MRNKHKNNNENKDADHQNDDEINIKEELSKSRNTITVMKKRISNSVNHINEAFVCQNLNKMICFTSIIWNAKNSDADDSYFSKDDCHYEIYAEDRKNRKYYFEISSSNESENKIGKKLDHQNESFIHANVTNALDSPQINYFLFVKDKGFIKITFSDKKSLVDAITELKFQNNLINAAEYENENNNLTEIEEEKEVLDDNNIINDNDNDIKENQDQEQKKQNEDNKINDIVINRKPNGQFTKSTIFRKVKKIRTENNEEEEVDFQKELTESRKRIKKMENCVSFNIGYMGEAYVYENLNTMECFTIVVWNAKTSDTKNPKIIINNKKQFHIKEDGGQYDIYAIDKNEKKYNFEIKSSSNSSSRNDISRAQREYRNNINQETESFIRAKVTHVLDTPKIKYSLFINNDFVDINFTNDKSLVQIIDEMKGRNLNL